MAKAKKSTARVLADALKEAVDETEELQNGGEEKIDEEVIRALTELEGADEIRWQIHRVSQPDPGFCGECSTGELTLQHIAECYGPGRYRVVGMRPNGQYFKSSRVSITKQVKKPETTADLASLMQGLQKSDTSGLMPLLLASMNSNAQIVAAALARPEKPDREFPWKEIIAVTPLALTGLKEFFARKDESGEAMDKFLKTLTIVEKLRGHDEKAGSTWTDIIRDAMSALPAMVTRTSAAQRTTGAESAANPRTVPQPLPGVPRDTAANVPASTDHGTAEAVATPEAIEATDEIKAMMWLREQLETLVTKAAANRNAVLYAEVFLEELPAFIPDEMIVQLLGDAQWFERLCQFDARVEPYRGWFETFTEALLNLIHEESDDDTGRTGNASGTTGSTSAADS